MINYFDPRDENFLKTMAVPEQGTPLSNGERDLAICEIEISGKQSVTVFTPNSAIAAMFGKRDRLMSFLGDSREDLSTISSSPGTYQYRTDRVRLFLTFDELERLVRLDLRPDEFLALEEKVGIFHEIHDDFYSSDGTAIQPR